MEKILGFQGYRINESRQTCFNRAKAEYIKNLKRYIEVAEAIPEDWEERNRKKALDKQVRL